MSDASTILGAEISSVLPDRFADRGITAVCAAGVSWNDLNETVHVAFGDGSEAYLKVAADGDGARIRRERAVVSYVGTHCDVDVPTVLASDPDAEPPYLLTAPMDRDTLAVQWPDLDRAERMTAFEQIGRGLAAVHEREFDRHGHVVDGASDGLALDAGAWSTILAERIDLMREIATADRFAHYYDEVADVVRAHRETLDRAPAALVHGDPAMPNIFRSDGSIGLVDWEIAHVGDPARELVRARGQLLEAREFDDEGFLTALYDGYRRRRGSLPEGLAERAPIYEAVRYLGWVGAFDKIVENGDEPRETVAARLESEMEDRLAAVRTHD